MSRPTKHGLNTVAGQREAEQANPSLDHKAVELQYRAVMWAAVTAILSAVLPLVTFMVEEAKKDLKRK